MTMKSQETKVVLIYLVSNNIQSLFDCPVVNNFHKRQEDLADILDEVRQSMYDVKMESKSLITFSIVENLLTSKEDDHQKSSNTPTKSNQQSKTPQLTKTKSKGDFNKTSSNFKENGLKTPKPNRNRKSEDTIDVQAYKTEAGKNTRPTTTVTNKSKPTKNEAKSEETKHRSIKKETHSKEKVSNIANNANSNNGAKVKKPITSTAPRVKSKDLKEEEKHGSTENNEEAKEELKTKEETTVAKKNIPAKKEEKKSLKPIKKEESKKEVKKPKESIKSPAKNTKNPKVDKPKDNKGKLHIEIQNIQKEELKKKYYKII
jgi:hypothetical protein